MNPTLKTKDFDFKALLGEGTFGKVYLVKRLKDGKQFVVKKQIENVENVWSSKILSAEVECLQTLRHPNVVSYYGAWQESGNFYILMEYATCGTLKHLLDERSSGLLEQDSLYLFSQILLGVHHIHSKNILHRDLKPENIMLTGRMGDIVKIGDFGLSRDLQHATYVGSNVVAQVKKSFELNYAKKFVRVINFTRYNIGLHVCCTGKMLRHNQSHAGSYYYVAPEILTKQPYDFKSDVWSMGVVLYEMLTKELPFPATSIAEIVQMTCKQKPQLFKSNYNSRGCKIIVYKILQRDPALRPSTRLLLLCPYLVSYIAKVYLNLGRSYAIPDHEFKLDIFQPFLKQSPSPVA